MLERAIIVKDEDMDRQGVVEWLPRKSITDRRRNRPQKIAAAGNRGGGRSARSTVHSIRRSVDRPGRPMCTTCKGQRAVDRPVDRVDWL